MSNARRDRSQPRRGLRRDEAAAYIGTSARKFDELVASGRMPKAKRIDKIPVWDIDQLDIFFDALPSEEQAAIVRPTRFPD